MINMIKQNLTKILISLGVVGVIGGGIMFNESILGGEADDIQHIIDTASSSQATYFATHGIYERTDPAIYNDLTYYCFQYVTPDTEYGYQLFIEKGSGTSTEWMSRGYGVEAESRTWDWRLKYPDEF